MEEELQIDSILGQEEIDNLFLDDEKTQETSPESEENKEEKEGKENNETTEVNVEELFTDKKPEGVGSEEENIEEKEDTSSKGKGTSPYFYSSIAKALREDGIFPNLDDDTLSKIKDPEDFKGLIEQQIKSNLDERQKRIDEALNMGIEPTEIKRYENTINFLNNITEDKISDEGDNGEKLRKELIFQDFINRGYSKERASREVQKSLNAGTDIEDAKEALKSNTEFFQEKYNNLINEAKQEAEQEEKERKEQAAALKKSILEDNKVFGDLSVDKSTRQRIYDNIAKPVYKDPDTGEYYTAIQKYEMENRVDFLKNVSLIFTLTDGFKNINNLIKGKVRKEVNKGIRELESVLNNTSRTSDGNLKYVSGVEEDSESFIRKGWDIDI